MALLVVAVLGGFGIGTVWTKSDTLVSMLVEPNQLATEMGAAQSFSDPGIRFLVKPGTRHGRTEYQWNVARFMGLRTRFGATRRKLETLDPGTRQAFLERIEGRMARLSSKDLLCGGTAICAVAAA